MMKAMLSFAFGSLVVFVPQGAKVQVKKPQDSPQKQLEAEFREQIHKLKERLDRLQAKRSYVKSKSGEAQQFLTVQAEISRARKKASESSTQGKKEIARLEREIRAMKQKLAKIKAPKREVRVRIDPSAGFPQIVRGKARHDIEKAKGVEVQVMGLGGRIMLDGLQRDGNLLEWAGRIMLDDHRLDGDLLEKATKALEKANKNLSSSKSRGRSGGGWMSGSRSKAHRAPSVLGVEGKVIWKELQRIRAEIRALRKLLEARSDRRVGRADSPGRSIRVQPGAVVETTDGERFTVPAGMEFSWKDGKLHSRQYAGIKSYSVSLGSVGAPISIPFPKIRAVQVAPGAEPLLEKTKKVESKSTGKVIWMEGENIKLQVEPGPKDPSRKTRVQVRRL